jgi:hypothetical protein
MPGKFEVLGTFAPPLVLCYDLLPSCAEYNCNVKPTGISGDFEGSSIQDNSRIGKKPS